MQTHPLHICAGIQQLDLLLEGVQLGLQVTKVVLLLLSRGRIPHKPVHAHCLASAMQAPHQGVLDDPPHSPQAPLPYFRLCVFDRCRRWICCWRIAVLCDLGGRSVWDVCGGIFCTSSWQSAIGNVRSAGDVGHSTGSVHH